MPRVSGRCAWFTFDELIGKPTSAADYLELVRSYDAFIVADVPGMTYRNRDLARRFITFIDAVYESHAKLVLTTAMPLSQLFVSKAEVRESMKANKEKGGEAIMDDEPGDEPDNERVEDAMSHLMEDLEHNVGKLKNLFSGDEEAFAFSRALSRLTEMGSREWGRARHGAGGPRRQWWSATTGPRSGVDRWRTACRRVETGEIPLLRVSRKGLGKHGVGRARGRLIVLPALRIDRQVDKFCSKSIPEMRQMHWRSGRFVVYGV